MRTETEYRSALLKAATAVVTSVDNRTLNLANGSDSRDEKTYLRTLLTNGTEALTGSIRTRLDELAASPPPVPPPPPRPWLEDAFGVFSPYVAYGARLAEWERWTGRPARWIADNLFEGRRGAAAGSDWEEIVHNVATAAYEYADVPAHVVLGLPLIPHSLAGAITSLSNGVYDDYHRRMAASLMRLHGRQLGAGVYGLRLRLWELNGNWMAAYGGYKPIEAKAAYERIIRLYKAVDSRFEFDWCPAIGAQNCDGRALMPDPTLLKGIGLDVYDEAYPTSHRVPAGTSDTDALVIFKRRFNERCRNGAYGLVAWANIAAANGLESNFTEWGCRNRESWDTPEASGGDNPWFIEAMRDHFRDLATGVYPGTKLGHHCYFERDVQLHSLARGMAARSADNTVQRDAQGKVVYGPTLFPKASAKFQELFGAAA